MKRVLIFYSKTGGGHLRAAQAIEEQLKQEKQVEITLMDGLVQSDFLIKLNTSLAFQILMNKFLFLYNLIYVLTDNQFGILVLRFFIKLTYGTTLGKIIKEQKPDLIISTHHHISPSTISYKEKPLPPFVMVVTDLGIPHRLWFDKKASLTVTVDKKMTDYAVNNCKLDQKKIKELGFMVLEKISKIKTSNKINNCILITGGGAGVGKIKEQVLELLKHLPGKQIVVVCGNNEKLFREISRMKDRRIKIYRFVDDIERLYKGADIIISKAGPTTIAEAAVLRKPLIITEWVGMQEKDNINFVLENNLGVYCREVDQLPTKVDQVYKEISKYNGKSFSFLSKKVGKNILDQMSFQTT